MKPHCLVVLAAGGIAGCASLLQTPPNDELKAAYDAMKQAVAVNADEYAAADMAEARQRYIQAWSYKDTAPDAARRLSEQSQVLAQVAQAKTEAVIAAQQRKAAQAEVDTLEQMARPTRAKR
jgi:hypothetical protein